MSVYKGTLKFYRRFIKTCMKSFDGYPEMFHRVRIQCRKSILENKMNLILLKFMNTYSLKECRDFLENNIIQVCENDNDIGKL